MKNNTKEFSPGLFRNKIIERQGRLGQDACEIMTSAIKAVDPYSCVGRFLKIRDHTIVIGSNGISKKDFDRIFVIGLGKAAVPMGMAVIDILGDSIDHAAVITKNPSYERFNGYGDKLKVMIGGHPVPTEGSIKSTRSLIDSLPKMSSRDIVIVLISGGGSALFTSPLPGVTLDDFQDMTEILLRSGADIKEINTMRKHLDEVKGGRLALKLKPAQIHTLILSDVVGDRLDMIASGPTVTDPTSYRDALYVVEKYQIGDKLPHSIINHLEKGAKGEIPETLKQDLAKDIIVKNNLIGSNHQSLEAGLNRAKSLGYRSLILSTHLTGDTQEVASFIKGIINSEIVHGLPLKKPACLLFGGETTVEVTGSGSGGRNQDLALRMVEHIAGIHNFLFISLATDGEDGPTDAAGAAIDGLIFEGANEEDRLNLKNFIENNNSYEFLDQKGALFKIGSTGTNVNDIVLVMFG